MKSFSPRRFPFIVALAATLLATTLLAAAPARAFDVDLSSVLAANPKVVEGVARLCKRACLGNQRRSWLESAILHTGTDGSSLSVVLKLRSRHSPARGVVLYDETATVKVDADVSLADCGIGTVHASSNNDLYRVLLRTLAPQIKAAIRRQGRFC
ncbi:MAG: hypothetical protein E7774_16675 [Bradyrhizobium sp.]|nr:MAG: hypothetical protein E7774_16675 [Bradyrhizobium sp.]